MTTAGERSGAESYADHFIDGAWRPSRSQDRIEVVDPATREVWASVPDASQEDVDAAVGAAHRAFTGGQWSGLRPSARAEILLRFAEEVLARSAEISRLGTRENGSPVAETSGAAANAAAILRYFASLAEYLEAEDIRAFPNGAGVSEVRRDPLGVCALIAPWNFPINLVVIKLAPALIAGNTVVIKPAEYTPLSIRPIMDAAAAGIPAGVINMVSGSGRAGEQLVRHPRVAKVAFTGSTGVGRRIGAICGELLRPVTLELGGKSAALILEDVDIEEFDSVFLRSCMRNTGQTCYISTRILAPRARYEEIVDRVRSVVESSPVGDPLDPATVFGPVANEAQYASVLDHLESARADGARFVTGGGPRQDLPGYYVQPTVLADVTAQMRVAQEEIFGPVVTIHAYDSLAEAIDLANSTDFGLGGIVFSADEERAREVALQIDSGSVGINFFASNHAAPFAGRHDSGLGVEYGIEGLEQYVTYKSIHRRPAPSA